MKVGKLISVCGIDGCGKSTLGRAIADHIRGKGVEVVQTSAISDNCTPICSRIGSILKDPNLPESLPPDAEMALLLAARVIAEVNVIEPALAAGKCVISDRYQACASIYQKGSDGKRIDPRLSASRMYSFGLRRRPDLEFVLDIDPEKTHKPHESDTNRLESRPMWEWKEMRDLYKQHSIRTPGVCRIDASLPVDEVKSRALHWVDLLVHAWCGK